MIRDAGSSKLESVDGTSGNLMEVLTHAGNNLEYSDLWKRSNSNGGRIGGVLSLKRRDMVDGEVYRIRLPLFGMTFFVSRFISVSLEE